MADRIRRVLCWSLFYSAFISRRRNFEISLINHSAAGDPESTNRVGWHSKTESRRIWKNPDVLGKESERIGVSSTTDKLERKSIRDSLTVLIRSDRHSLPQIFSPILQHLIQTNDARDAVQWKRRFLEREIATWPLSFSRSLVPYTSMSSAERSVFLSFHLGYIHRPSRRDRPTINVGAKCVAMWTAEFLRSPLFLHIARIYRVFFYIKWS